MLADLLGVIEHVKIHLFTRSQRTSAWFNLEDLLVEDLFLECLSLAGGAWVSP